MVNWTIYYSSQAKKDAKKLASSHLRPQAENLLEILSQNPFQNPPSYEKLRGDFDEIYSRRINIQHRLVYRVNIKEKLVKVLSMWTHYE